MDKVISQQAIIRRNFWVNEIKNISGNFSSDFDKLEIEIAKDIKENGITALIDHLRLCGSIPELYAHDSSEEKLYSKYTDCLLSFAFKALGFNSLVIKERADSADVEAYCNTYNFVADAKAFRLSRTAKNQKDFKIQAMNGWKRGKPYAMVVCPIYQLPKSSSQIYQSATKSDVCIFTYSHLSLLLSFSKIEGIEKVQELICNIFKTVPALNPSKSATDYWLAINRTMLDYSSNVLNLWSIEKIAALESIEIAKNEDLIFLSKQREKIMLMDHAEALAELIKLHKIDSKIKVINNIKDNGLFSIK